MIEKIAFLIALHSWLLIHHSTQKRFLHILQLEDYEAIRIFRVIRSRISHLQIYGVEVIGLSGMLFEKTFLISSLVWSAGCIWRFYRNRNLNRAAKKRLVMTKRAKRIFYVSVTIAFLLIAVLFAIYYRIFNDDIRWVTVSTIASLYLIERLSPVWLSLSLQILKPIEQNIQNRYLNDARLHITEINPTVIGITGSYGKTGTKEILSAILAEKYSVLKPPGSYNTLMGVTRLIREQLRPYHEMFVAEMGAYRRGSIKRLCDLTSPKHAIITIIGLQHLERFGTQDAIQKAKGELVDSLPPDGTAVLNGDDPRCRAIGESFNGNVIYFSTQQADPGIPTVVARDINLTPKGSHFTLVFHDNTEQPVHLPLLGRPAIANATAAAAMAYDLGVPLRSIKQALAHIPQVEHRLESKPGENGITIIDDAFNSNPIGAASALEVLSNATEGRRILVTPGMIELGDIEEAENYKFGKIAAESCDLAVLVGVKRVQPIKKGMIEGGFPEENIWVVSSLNQGLEKLKSYLKPGDTMLLENDLPDQYDGV